MAAFAHLYAPCANVAACLSNCPSWEDINVNSIGLGQSMVFRMGVVRTLLKMYPYVFHLNKESQMGL